MEFEKMRLELSWRYFDFHARQRTQLFHFFVILSPFVFGGCFYLLKERSQLGGLPGIIAPCAGALLVIVFFGLDRRNRQMIEIAEEALMLLEQHLLFASFRTIGSAFPGPMTKEHEVNCKRRFAKCRGHTFLISLVYLLAFALFLALSLYAFLIESGHLLLTS
ncbi:hypothetical protein XH83_33745 [Bradyrhizobium sp. CCBAU 53351]|nr:hypothetical protein XH83_33745 [Bradyrhizobium sp. CCBAU 53351]